MKFEILENNNWIITGSCHKSLVNGHFHPKTWFFTPKIAISSQNT